MSLLPSATFSAPGVPLYGSGGGGGGGGPVLNVSTINLPSAGGSIDIGATVMSNVNVSTFSIVNGGASKTIGTTGAGVVREILSAASTTTISSKLALVDGTGAEVIALNTNVSSNGSANIFLADSFGSFQPKGVVSFVSSIGSSPGGLILADDSQAIKNSMTIGASTISFATEDLSLDNNGGSIPSYQVLAIGSNYEIVGGTTTAPLFSFSTITGKDYMLTLAVQSLSNANISGVSLLGVKGPTYETYFGKWGNDTLCNVGWSGSPTCYYRAETSNATVFGVNSSSSTSTIMTTGDTFGILRLD